MSLPQFFFNTTAEEVADALANEIKGKNVLVTGTSLNGIGFETAKAIAKYANLVVITGYNEERLKSTEDALKRDLPSANIRRLILDLSSLAAVRKAAAEVNKYSEPIHVLIHNAAAAAGSFKLTVDNLESQMATDHIGPFLFTKLIAPKLLSSATATANYTPRVVWVSSGAHAMMGSGVNFATIGKPDEAGYQGLEAYSQAKSANVLMGIEIGRRSAGRVKGYSLHPGIIYTNMNQKEEVMGELKAIGVLRADGTPNTDNIQWKTLAQGAATTVTAAFNPRLNDVPGAYLDDCNVANDKIAAHSSDTGNAKKLWDVTEEIIGEKFAF
ncbi:short-chain dehydrogenase/reductase family protein [Favolaschia claudopus]|uniref:Short-chain dehydrogenase/reductase family protein n=1 Tax=Favolaschia claudopus TaxID=2862362 RepID=A0AAW0CJE0_9AGAR